MGEVYRARDPRLGRDVAIKVLPASFSNDPDRLKRFEQEARAAGVLNHPNVTIVYDIGQHDGAPYVVQELLEGETLRAELAGGRFSPRKAIEYAVQIAQGLAAAHEKGIVHRDLKPENLFVTNDGRVKILDFGLAKLTQVEGSGSTTSLPTATEPGVVMGTLGYMSPEQIKAKPADARSDIFALGAILYEMLSGQRAFRGDSAGETMAAILKEDPPDLSVTNQSISPGPRADRAPLPREEPRAPLPVRLRHRLRPRSAVQRLRIHRGGSLRRPFPNTGVARGRRVVRSRRHRGRRPLDGPRASAPAAFVPAAHVPPRPDLRGSPRSRRPDSDLRGLLGRIPPPPLLAPARQPSVESPESSRAGTLFRLPLRRARGRETPFRAGLFARARADVRRLAPGCSRGRPRRRLGARRRKPRRVARGWGTGAARVPDRQGPLQVFESNRGRPGLPARRPGRIRGPPDRR